MESADGQVLVVAGQEAGPRIDVRHVVFQERLKGAVRWACRDPFRSGLSKKTYFHEDNVHVLEANAIVAECALPAEIRPVW